MGVKRLISVVVGILALSVSATCATDTQPINVVAKRFQFSPAEITVKRGEKVTLLIHSEDVAHGIKFKELNVQADVPKGKTVEVTFTPTQAGTFIGRCSHFCGLGHGRMKLTLHVME